MANLIRCDCCLGRKRIKGLGNIEQDCPGCRGIGWIEDSDKKLESELHERMNKAKSKKKPKIINPEEVVHC